MVDESTNASQRPSDGSNPVQAWIAFRLSVFEPVRVAYGGAISSIGFKFSSLKCQSSPALSLPGRLRAGDD